MQLYCHVRLETLETLLKQNISGHWLNKILTCNFCASFYQTFMFSALVCLHNSYCLKCCYSADNHNNNNNNNGFFITQSYSFSLYNYAVNAVHKELQYSVLHIIITFSNSAIFTNTYKSVWL